MAVIISSGTSTVSSGMILSSPSILSAGSVWVTSGGKVVSANVYSSGHENIYSGGIDSGASIYYYGSMRIALSGSAVNPRVASGGVINVDEGVVRSAVVLSRGLLNVSGRSSAAGITRGYAYNTVVSGGSLFANQYATISNTLINNWGIVSLCGIAESTTIGLSGHLDVSSGGKASNTVVDSGGIMWVYSGGSANGIFVRAGGMMYVSPSGFAYNNYVSSGGELGINHDGRVLSTTVYDSGRVVVYSGGSASETMLSSGTLVVNESATADMVTVYNGGYAVFSSGATGSGIKENGGYVNVQSGASVRFQAHSFSANITHDATVHKYTVASAATVYSGGRLNVLSGGEATSVFANFSGTLNVSSGGRAMNTTVNNSGTLNLSSGGTAEYTLVNNGGTMNFYDGGRDHRTTISGTLNLSSGGTAYETTVFGKANVFSEGVMSSATVSSGGTLNVSSGGSAVRTTTFGTMLVGYRGIASRVNVVSNGTLVVSLGGKVTGELSFASGGSASFQSGGILDFDITSRTSTTYSVALVKDLSLVTGTPTYTLTVKDDQTEASYVLAKNAAGFNKTISVVNAAGSTLGTLAVGSTSKIGGVDYTLNLDTDSVLSVTVGSGSDVITGDITNETVDVLDGMYASSVNINSAGVLNVSSGGSAGDVTVNDGGLLEIEIGGTANGTTVNLLGRMTVSSGGITDSTFLEGAPISSISLWEWGDPFSGGRLEIDSGGNATNIVAADGAILVISVVPDTYVQGTYAGSAFEIRDGLANDFTVNDYCRLDIASGGTANRMTVKASFYHYGYEYARAYVSSGGTANSTSITGGSVFVSLGGIANDTTIIDEGGLGVECGGVANGITMIGSDTELEIDGGGTATNIVAPEGASLQLTVAPDTYIQGTYAGSAFEIKDGLVSDYTVHGWLRISSGGTASNITNESGYMTVSCGGKLTGRMMFESGARVSAYTGAVLDFDLSKTSAGAASLVNDLSIVQGTPNFTLTVSDSQVDGEYSLAGGASAFSGTITVKSLAGANLGTLTLGQTATILGKDYTLNLNDTVTGSILTVTVSSEPVPPTPDWVFFNGDFNGDGFAMLAIETSDATGTAPTASVTIYQNGEPWGLGLTLDPGWDVVGVGDFNADGRDDFLRVNEEGYVVGQMANENGIFSPQVLNFKGAGWDILGTGDFNGNGSGDVLVANPNGASETVGLLGYWESGVTWTLINGYSAEWECVSTGDFNGDGKCDMLWRNRFEGEGGGTYNAYCTWIVEDPVDWRMVSVANPAEWNFLCSGDFDGNGSHDIAMINDVGVVGIWGVGDGYLNSWSILSAVTSEWQLAGVADFNADGTDDIAWVNTDTGLTGYWQINDKQLTTWSNIANLA